PLVEDRRALVVELELILGGGGPAEQRIERHLEPVQPATKIDGALGVPAAVRQHVEGAAIAAVAVLVPAAQVHRHSGAEAAEGVAELILRVRGHAGDADEALVDEGLSLEDDRLGSGNAAGGEQHDGRTGDAGHRPVPARVAQRRHWLLQSCTEKVINRLPGTARSRLRIGAEQYWG